MKIKKDFTIFCDNCVFNNKKTCGKYGFEFHYKPNLRNADWGKCINKCSLWRRVDEPAFKKKLRKSKWTLVGHIRRLFDTRMYRSWKYSKEHNSVRFNLEQLLEKVIEDGYVEIYLKWAESGFESKNRPNLNKIIQDKPWTLDNFSLVKSRN